MSFAFGFAGDDIDDDDHDMLGDEPSGAAAAKTVQSLLLPKMHPLSDLVSPHVPRRCSPCSWRRSTQCQLDVVLAAAPAY